MSLAALATVAIGVVGSGCSSGTSSDTGAGSDAATRPPQRVDGAVSNNDATTTKEGGGVHDAGQAGDATDDARSEGGDATPQVADGAGPFVLAASGCAMGHCTPLANDRDPLDPPATGTRAWKDTSVPGANVQVGCSGNGTVAVCGLSGSSRDGGTPTLVAYAPDGGHVWTYDQDSSGFPAPMVDIHGGAIAANSDVVVRIGADGTVLWSRPGPGGAPKTPTPVANAFVFLATSPSSIGPGVAADASSAGKHAPVATYDVSTGEKVGSYDVVEPQGSTDPSYFYSSSNSPAVSGMGAYVVMARYNADGSSDACSVGRLVAFDVAADGAITVAWRSPPFQAPSGASPMVIGSQIYFDGASPTLSTETTGDGGASCGSMVSAPSYLLTTCVGDGGVRPSTGGTTKTGYFFDIEDEGTTGVFQWGTNIGGPAEANAPEDPRGGLWVYPFGTPSLIHLDATTGACLSDSFFDLASSIPGASTVASDMTMSGSSASHPVMLLSILAGISNEVCALDLASTANRVEWCVPSGVAAGQFPIVEGPSGPVVVYATAATGIEAISR